MTNSNYKINNLEGFIKVNGSIENAIAEAKGLKEIATYNSDSYKKYDTIERALVSMSK